MTTLASARIAVIGGVDTHADVHVAAVCDQLGGVLGTRSFPTTSTGYRGLLRFLASFGDLEAVGVEGTGSYGSGLARYLADEGVRVVEVNRPNRQVRRAHGKTDTVDAIAAARAVISGQARVQPKAHDGSVEALRSLQIVHRSAHKARTQALNQLHSLVVTAPDSIRDRLRDLPRRQLLAVCRAYRPADRDDVIAITKLSLRELAIRIADLDDQIARVAQRRRRLLAQTAPALIAINGVGPDTATTLLLAAGDNPDRLGSQASFAALLGASPIPASSGKTQRMRLNRGGDRLGNAALWRIVITRMATQPDTRAYVERRTKEGLSKPEIIRCLKRYVAREVFNALPRELLT
jgi:transposase